MKSGSLFVVAVLLSAGLSLPALAQSSDTTTTILQGLQKMDRGAAPKAPAASPAQGTGGLSFDQMKAAAIARASMAAIDTDRNGSVSREELAALTNQFFDVADSNRDGQLSEEELSTFAANMNRVLSMLR